jgi:hypothetical protein
MDSVSMAGQSAFSLSGPFIAFCSEKTSCLSGGAEFESSLAMVFDPGNINHLHT